MSEVSQNLPLSDDFKAIVLNNTPLIDVRAPVEFVQGAFPDAVNLPIMNDEERRLVGIRYKEAGNDAAVKLGHKLVSGEIKEARVAAWCAMIQQNPDAMLYCFRGGQRSRISQQWVLDAGYEIARIKGGYKAFRNYLMRETDKSVERFKPVVIGGRTGSGKTILIKKVNNSIDLEGHANHRGSSFGRKIVAQPTQINFENALAYDLIQKLEQGFGHLVFEDEGRNVGAVYIPRSFAAYLSDAPRVILEMSTEERVETTFNEYVQEAQQAYADAGLDEPFLMWQQDIRGAMERIKKRLGGDRYVEVCAIFDRAVEQQDNTGSLEGYKPWAEYLLTEYYDPMYDYQIQKRSAQIVFRGNEQEVLEYLEQYK